MAELKEKAVYLALGADNCHHQFYSFIATHELRDFKFPTLNIEMKVRREVPEEGEYEPYFLKLMKDIKKDTNARSAIMIPVLSDAYDFKNVETIIIRLNADFSFFIPSSTALVPDISRLYSPLDEGIRALIKMFREYIPLLNIESSRIYLIQDKGAILQETQSLLTGGRVIKWEFL